MPAKQVEIDGVGTIKVYKRKGVKSVRLSIVGDGTVRVTQPSWLPYKVGIDFATSRRQWITDNVVQPQFLEDGQLIGKTYQLHFSPLTNQSDPIARTNGKHIIIYFSPGTEITDDAVQACAKKAVERALKRDAEELLIPRVAELAAAHGFTYKSAAIRKLRSRWGSCTNKKDILLSSYLVQLPWELIDYVILHELQHTEVLAHGKDFWVALDRHIENLPLIKKTIKQYQARIL